MAALLVLLVIAPGARVAADTRAISVLSYNVQNLFDAVEQGAEYDEFRAGRWDAARYAARLNRIAAVLRDVHPGGADVLALQEVENRRAALDLRDRLRDLGYAYVVAVPNDGADLGLTLTPVVLSRLPVLRVRLHQVWHDGRYLRPIVEAELDLGGGRSLFLFNNHWKSKRGGAEETAPARRAAATVLGDRIRELQRTDPLADVLVTGDLNESVDDHAAAGYPTALAGLPRGTAGVLAITGRPFDARPPAGGVVLYSPWLELEAAGRGTVVHRDAWETPDHFLLSAGLFDRQGVWYAPGGFAVIRDGLVSSATGYPLRWIGTDGHSDHLPILLHLQRGGSSVTGRTGLRASGRPEGARTSGGAPPRRRVAPVKTLRQESSIFFRGAPDACQASICRQDAIIGDRRGRSRTAACRRPVAEQAARAEPAASAG